MDSVAVRHRLLEAVLLRLARLPNAGHVALRGGMLLRHWFDPFPRTAEDLDLVADHPLNLSDVSRFRPLFTEDIGDGVVFESDDIDVEGIWLQTKHPGIRMHIRAAVNGFEHDLQIDVTGGPRPTPSAVLSDFPTAAGVASIWVCRPESVVGQKLQALWHLGQPGWRPKDLNDLYLLLKRIPIDQEATQQAISAAFDELGGTGRDARGVFGSESWWTMKHASARWGDYLAESGQTEPRNLSTVVSEVATRLKPMIEDLP